MSCDQKQQKKLLCTYTEVTVTCLPADKYKMHYKFFIYYWLTCTWKNLQLQDMWKDREIVGYIHALKTLESLFSMEFFLIIIMTILYGHMLLSTWSIWLFK